MACLEDNQFNRHFYPVAVIMKSGSYVKYKDTRTKSAKNNNKWKVLQKMTLRDHQNKRSKEDSQGRLLSRAFNFSQVIKSRVEQIG